MKKLWDGIKGIYQLHLQIAPLMKELAEAHKENEALRLRLRELETKADIRSKVELRGRVYYLTEPLKGYSEGPFCALCLDEDGILITAMPGAVAGYWRCRRCERKRHA